jgi:hypothetical protein
MKSRFRVIQVGWEIDLDDNRHPRIQIGRANWSAVVYDHPTEGWQVIALEIELKAKQFSRFEEYAGTEAETKLREIIDGELVFADPTLGAIANDLYEYGRKGAMKRWENKIISLSYDKLSNQEVR